MLQSASEKLTAQTALKVTPKTPSKAASANNSLESKNVASSDNISETASKVAQKTATKTASKTVSKKTLKTASKKGKKGKSSNMDDWTVIQLKNYLRDQKGKHSNMNRTELLNLAKLYAQKPAEDPNITGYSFLDSLILASINQSIKILKLDNTYPT